MIYLGFLLIGLSILIGLTALVWQLVEAFKTSTGWGVASLLGLFLLAWLPNLIWCFVHFDKGWRVLVASLGHIIPMFIGMLIVGSEMSLRAIA